jgi:hypothetical protein
MALPTAKLRTLAGIGLSVFLLGACEDEAPDKPHVEFLGGGFVFNYNVAEAYYGFVLKVVRKVPAGTVLEARFEDPAGGAPLVVRQKTRPTRRDYRFESPAVHGVVAGRDYRIEVRLLEPGRARLSAQPGERAHAGGAGRGPEGRGRLRAAVARRRATGDRRVSGGRPRAETLSLDRGQAPSQGPEAGGSTATDGGRGMTLREEMPTGQYDPTEAVFWGRFPEEGGEAGHVPTVGLYETRSGEWFLYRIGKGVAPHPQRADEAPDVAGGYARVFERQDEVWPWVESALGSLKKRLGAGA